MGKSRRRKIAARNFRAEEEMGKVQWKEYLLRDKEDVSYDVPTIREKYEVKNKYPKKV